MSKSVQAFLSLTKGRERKVLDDSRAFHKNNEWFRTYRSKVVADYPNEYVLIYNEKVIDHDKNYSELVKRLRNYPRTIQETVAIQMTHERKHLLPKLYV